VVFPFFILIFCVSGRKGDPIGSVPSEDCQAQAQTVDAEGRKRKRTPGWRDPEYSGARPNSKNRSKSNDYPL